MVRIQKENKLLHSDENKAPKNKPQHHKKEKINSEYWERENLGKNPITILKLLNPFLSYVKEYRFSNSKIFEKNPKFLVIHKKHLQGNGKKV